MWRDSLRYYGRYYSSTLFCAKADMCNSASFLILSLLTVCRFSCELLVFLLCIWTYAVFYVVDHIYLLLQMANIQTDTNVITSEFAHVPQKQITRIIAKSGKCAFSNGRGSRTKQRIFKYLIRAHDFQYFSHKNHRYCAQVKCHVFIARFIRCSLFFHTDITV